MLFQNILKYTIETLKIKLVQDVIFGLLFSPKKNQSFHVIMARGFLLLWNAWQDVIA